MSLPTHRPIRRAVGQRWVLTAVVAVLAVGLCVPAAVGAETPDEGTVTMPDESGGEIDPENSTGSADEEDEPDDPDERPGPVRDGEPPGVEFIDDDGDVTTTVTTNGSGTDARLSITTYRANTPVTVSAERLTASQLFRIFAGRSPDGVARDARPGNLDDATTVNGVAMFEPGVDGADSTIVLVDATEYDGSTVSFEATSAGEYAFQFEEVGRIDGLSGRADVTVVDEDHSARFDRPVYETTAGDLATVTVSFQNTDAGYLIVGGDRRTSGSGLRNYLDVLYVEDGATFTINTRLIGTDAPTENVYRPQSGTVVSYAHKYSADTPPASTREFQSLSFERPNGVEVADTLEEFRAHLGITPLSRPLQPARYRLLAGAGGDVVVRDDGVPEFRHSLARSNLRLTQPGIGPVTTYVAPRDGADEVTATDGPPAGITERSTVANGDRLVVAFGGNGTTGAMVDIAGDTETAFEPDLGHFVELDDRQEGVNLTITEIDTDPNESPNSVDLASAVPQDATLIAETDPDQRRIEQFYLVIDTRHRRPFVSPPDSGDTYRVEYSYELPPGERYRFQNVERPPAFEPANDPADDGTEHFPYLTAEQSVTTTFTIEEPRVEYDQMSKRGRLVLEPTADATISGQTNLAPGTPYWIHVVAGEQTPARTVSVTSGTVSSDGGFSTAADLATLSVGESVDVEFYTSRPGTAAEDQRLLDEQRGVTVADGAQPAVFEVTRMPAETAVDPGEPLSNFSATVRNNGTVEGQQNVTFTIGNETVRRQVELLDPNESVTYSYDDVFPNRPPGTYNVSVSTDTDRRNGSLLVRGEGTPTPAGTTTQPTATPAGTTPADATATPAGTPAPTATPAGTADSPGTPSGDDQQNSLPVPPLGAGRARDALGAGAIVGGAYLLDYFL